MIKMCDIHFTNSIKILIPERLWKRRIIEVFRHSWTASLENLCCVETTAFFKKRDRFSFLLISLCITKPSANSRDQKLQGWENFTWPHGFRGGNGERNRAIYGRGSSNRSSTKNADTTDSRCTPSPQRKPCICPSVGKSQVFSE